MAASMPSEKRVDENVDEKPAQAPKAEIKSAGDEELLEFLKNGENLIKVRHKKKYNRSYSVTEDLKSIEYTGSAKFMKSDQNSISIENIQEVRSGIQTDSFNKANKKKSFSEELGFSVLYGNNEKALDLLAESKEHRDKWVKGLRYLARKAKREAQQKQEQRWIHSFYELADKNNDGWISFDEVMRLLDKMNVTMSEKDVKKLYLEASGDKESSGEEDRYNFGLNYKKFISFYYLLTKRPEIQEIFDKYDGDDALMTATHLMKFLNDSQKDVMLHEEAYDSMITKYEPDPDLKEKKLLSVKGFRMMLMSEEGRLASPIHKTVHHDMSKPLNQYFISSSHNTYLIKDQLKGPSSVEGYIKALQKGCRCVELDCWDGDNLEPVIYHGYTLTSKILFRDVVSAINEYAFQVTPYPLILSLENHCSIDQQKVMAHYLKTLLGDKLYLDAVPGDSDGFPSPESLMNKILIKGKRLPAEVENMNEGEMSEEDEAADLDNDEVKDEVSKKKKGKKIKVAKELSDMVNYCKAVHFHDFEHSRNNYQFYEMSSFGETKNAEKLSSESPSEYNEHNRRFLSRIYPGGLRTDSSNYDPVPMWNAGCQIVALNFQTGSLPLNMNQGRFTDNGMSGYILKPDFMLKGDYNPNGPFPRTMKKTMTLKVISGAMLPKANQDKEVIDPFVKVRVSGVPMDNQQHKTKYIKDNGLNPSWNETFAVPVEVPELALVRFCVHDHDQMSGDEFIGQYTLPFNSMQRGYRHIVLEDRQNVSLFPAVLFVHVDID